MDKPKIEVSLIVAAAQNGVIGRDGDMPWILSTDLKRFKALTLGKPVIMGRKTYDSIGKALPGRPNFVVTRSGTTYLDAKTCGSLDEAIVQAKLWCRENACTEICIIGGGQIYASALPITTKLHVTHVLAEIEGDTRFPDILDSHWKPISRQAYPAGDKDSEATLYVVYERKLAI